MAVAQGSSTTATGTAGRSTSGFRIVVAPAATGAGTARDGRLLLVISTDSSAEPREQMSDHDDTQQLFGIDVHGVSASRPGVFDASVFGYPRASLASVPPGRYWVQAVLHPYEVWHRADGHTVELPPDHGEGQQWSRAPGSPMSRPKWVRIDPRHAGEVRITLDSTIPPLPEVPDTKYVKHIRIQSDRLTRFWGRPMFLGAIIVLPEGFDSHPEAHYPLAIYQGHFQRQPPGWREEPPDTSLPAPDTAKIARECPNGSERKSCDYRMLLRLAQESGYNFYKMWTAPGFPRVIQVTIQHANPYYDDSYAVNSENLGPYGDAIMYELLPYITRTFRGLGPWARAVYGGSTGGWEALASQVMYPDEVNGAYANCPDPIDFHAFTTLDIYSQPNAYVSVGPWRTTPRPAERDYLGQTRVTMEQANVKELVLGTRSRSGGQWDIWEAVFSPVGPDGYPQRIYDKRTGRIDTAVAAYWREHYDLVHIMRRDWPALGPKLQGKLHFNVGLSDNFFLNDAVYLAQDFAKRSTAPHSDATFDYGLRDEHCWSGDHTVSNAVSRLTYDTRFIPQMAAHWRKTAPKGADVTSWRY